MSTLTNTPRLAGAATTAADILRLPAVEILQRGRPLYLFATSAADLPRFTAVARTRRPEPDGELCGYQRPEVLSHVAAIRDYLGSPGAMLPNALVIPFDPVVSFEPLPGQPVPATPSRVGTLLVPAGGDRKAGWLVDGQQRSAALREADAAGLGDFWVPVVAFVADDEGEQREQFLLVNSAKPLPKSLVYELLPGTGVRLAKTLEKRRYPARLLTRLNADEDSPLRGRIRTATNPNGTIQDNSVLKALGNSLSDGVLYEFVGRRGDGPPDEEGLLGVLKAYWGAVARVFRTAWELPPRRSRLTHGAGLTALGLLLDTIVDVNRPAESRDAKAAGKAAAPDWAALTEEFFCRELGGVADACHWTSGTWELGEGRRRRWNEVQNTGKDTRLLADHLQRLYMRRWAQTNGERDRSPEESASSLEWKPASPGMCAGIEKPADVAAQQRPPPAHLC